MFGRAPETAPSIEASLSLEVSRYRAHAPRGLALRGMESDVQLIPQRYFQEE